MAKPAASKLATLDPSAAPVVSRESQALDRLIHEKIRLGIVSALAASGPLAFVELKALLNASDGNISVHARKLEEAGYISCSKSFVNRTPRSEFELTPAGRAALGKYLDHLEALVGAIRPK